MPKRTLNKQGPLDVTMHEATMPLNNDGDTVVLIDPTGVGRSMNGQTKYKICRFIDNGVAVAEATRSTLIRLSMI